MSKKTKSLPKAPSYVYIEKNLGRVFNRDRTYNVDKMTDKEIEILLETDLPYWGKKFKKISPLKSGNKKTEKEV